MPRLSSRLHFVLALVFVLAAMIFGLGLFEASLRMWPNRFWLAGLLGTLFSLLIFWGSWWTMAPCFFDPGKFFGRLAWSLIVLTVVLRILYMGLVNLIPEEAYYWKYAQNLDYGYLDHPPLVALSIYVGELAAGTSEFGVRILAMFWWSAAAFFIYKLTELIYGSKAAVASILLWSLLPFYFAVGFFMSPDAPLVTFWAAGTYFLFRILVLGEVRFWWVAGLCLGLGFLGKYSIALLGFSAVVFMIIDPAARRQFLSPSPYLAGLLALLCASPVLYWNWQHDWASLAFQSVGRLNAESEFSLPSLLAFLLLTLMPAGVIIFGFAFKRWSLALCGCGDKAAGSPCMQLSPSIHSFIAVFTLTPLFVFVFFSLSKEVKINWLGPVFIPLLPLLSASLVEAFEGHSIFYKRMWRTWLATFLLVFFGFGLFFLYIGVRIPGIPYTYKMHKFMGGRELARKVLELENPTLGRNSQPRVVVGTDKHYLASQLGFYRAALAKGAPPPPTQGRHLLARSSLMHSFWGKPVDFRGRDMVLVSRNPGDLGDDRLLAFFRKVGPLERLTTERNGYKTFELFYRIGEGYRPRMDQADG
ncbi:MAG: glycosyltransferase family 39 protein [Deltaproteobacteria bacterium]|nr:glycosyltransferase family 39 protein [Deltaproteobacteria bacterium]